MDMLAPPPSSLLQTTAYGPLHPGASWSGIQKSGRSSYHVRVEIHTVSAHALTGLLEIHGLTPELDSLVTFFEGEIVGTETGFLTAKWGAKEGDDLRHWNRFSAFRGLKNELKRPGLTYNHQNRSCLFMRWKEQFVVPEYKVQNINGASFAGFYFLCLELNPAACSPVATTVPLPSPTCRPAQPPLAALRRPSYSVPSRPIPAPVHVAVEEAAVSNNIDLSSPFSSEDDAEDESDRSLSPLPPPTPTQQAAPRPVVRRRQTMSYAAIVRRGSTTSIAPTDEKAELDDSSATTTGKDVAPPLLSPAHLLDSAASLEFPLPPLSPSLSSPASPPPISRRLLSPTSLGRRSSSSVPASSSLSTGSDAKVTGRSRSSTASGRLSSSGDRQGSHDTAPLGPWPNARITGFYYFKHSEPFQELELTYDPRPTYSPQSHVSRSNDCGAGMGAGHAGTGSGSFAFR